jgi:hypothetical protein
MESKTPALRVKAVFLISPPGPFGLPDGNHVVVPAPAQIYSPVIDTNSGLVVSHGTLSRYRNEDEGIKEQVTVGAVALHFHDNYVTTDVEASDEKDGLERSRTAVVRLLRHLMIDQGGFFTASLMQHEVVGRKARVASQPTMTFSMSVYNLDELRGRIRAAAEGASHTDDRLDRALLYFEHARFLHKLSSDPTLTARHRNYLVASSFLFLWKAITTILGEPGTDRDYQRRFREYGLPDDFWREKVQPLKAVRDAADVAHYELDAAAIARPVASFGAAEQVCREVFRAYTSHLLPKPQDNVPDT